MTVLSVCLPSDALSQCLPLTWFSLTLDVGYLFMAAPDRTLKDELPRSVGAQYATGDQWRNNPRKNEGMEPKQKEHPVVDGTGDGSRV